VVRVPEGVGLGFDVHARDPERPLVLGGVSFDGEPGVAAHSDGDVVCHAVADALLGAAALGDVGDHFPDTDPATAGISGTVLLERTRRLLAEAHRRPEAVDLTVVCERPRLGDRRAEMRERLAEALALPMERVSVKATRPEGLGLTGDGIGCLAIALVR
jgi:2-C-methyl-D-erythritol 2,4-cyclodiphosphate synthase